MPDENTPDIEPETTEETETEETEDFNLQDVERIYYGPDELENASVAINEIMANVDGKNVTFNFKPDDASSIPDGFGLAIVPNTRRVEGQGVVTYGVTVAAMPDPSTVLANENGEDFVRKLVTENLLSKVANSSRQRPDGTSGTLPVSLADFMEARRGRGEGLKTYTAIASHFVKALRKKGLKLINAQILRNCLQSAMFATEQFEKIEQSQWELVLNLMIAKANEQKLDPAILNDWKDKRDAFEIESNEDVDFGDLADLI